MSKCMACGSFYCKAFVGKYSCWRKATVQERERAKKRVEKMAERVEEAG